MLSEKSDIKWGCQDMIEIAKDKICKGIVCASCQLDMEEEYVVRRLGNIKKTVCDRCGKEILTSEILYTLGYKGFKRRGWL